MAPANSLLVPVTGTFYKAVDPAYDSSVLEGSHAPGRYSSEKEPTLYLSSSIEGVEAAMIKHSSRNPRGLELLTFTVDALAVADLRDAEAMAHLGVDPQDALGDWQAHLAAGRTPPSWLVRRRLEDLGAQGLIDPSRKRPGLWHLTLFTWNRAGAPTVVAPFGT